MTDQVKVLLPKDKKLTLKFKLWAKYYLDPTSKTFGNATQSAMKSYNVANEATAATIGWENVRKLENVVPMMAESIGLTLPVLLQRFSESAKSFDQIERLIERLGYLSPIEEPNTDVTLNQFNFRDLGKSIAQSRLERGLVVEDAVVEK